jgi:hypothetical protein
MGGAVTTARYANASPAKAGAQYQRSLLVRLALSNRVSRDWAPAFVGEAF